MPGRPHVRANVAARWLPLLLKSRAFHVSTQSTRSASSPRRGFSSRDARRRSNGCGMPMSAPWSRAAAIASRTGNPDGTGRSRKTQMRSPSRVRTSSPIITTRPAGAASRARSAPSIRSWSVIARCVSPRDAAAWTTDAGEASESKLESVWQWRSITARCPVVSAAARRSGRRCRDTSVGCSHTHQASVLIRAMPKVRAIRDELERRVRKLMAELGVEPRA